ncbi:MAG: SocA family protein [Cellvibrionales bacterium]|nr:SocA family protein [Cellvibrionales bacterium]
MPYQRPEAVANEFLRRARRTSGAGLTQIQLQNLVYLAHGWTLAYTNQPLTAIEPEAWDGGAVYPELDCRINHIGLRPLKDLIRENDDNPFAVLGTENRGPVIRGKFLKTENRIIDMVWRRYGHLHGFSLSRMLHEEDTPWHTAYYPHGQNTPIPNEETRRYYHDLGVRLTEEQTELAA